MATNPVRASRRLSTVVSRMASTFRHLLSVWMVTSAFAAPAGAETIEISPESHWVPRDFVTMPQSFVDDLQGLIGPLVVNRDVPLQLPLREASEGYYFTTLLGARFSNAGVPRVANGDFYPRSDFEVPLPKEWPDTLLFEVSDVHRSFNRAGLAEIQQHYKELRVIMDRLSLVSEVDRSERDMFCRRVDLDETRIVEDVSGALEIVLPSKIDLIKKAAEGLVSDEDLIYGLLDKFPELRSRYLSLPEASYLRFLVDNCVLSKSKEQLRIEPFWENPGRFSDYAGLSMSIMVADHLISFDGRFLRLPIADGTAGLSESMDLVRAVIRYIRYLEAGYLLTAIDRSNVEILSRQGILAFGASPEPLVEVRRELERLLAYLAARRTGLLNLQSSLSELGKDAQSVPLSEMSRTQLTQRLDRSPIFSNLDQFVLGLAGVRDSVTTATDLRVWLEAQNDPLLTIRRQHQVFFSGTDWELAVEPVANFSAYLGYLEDGLKFSALDRRETVVDLAVCFALDSLATGPLREADPLLSVDPAIFLGGWPNFQRDFGALIVSVSQPSITLQTRNFGMSPEVQRLFCSLELLMASSTASDLPGAPLADDVTRLQSLIDLLPPETRAALGYPVLVEEIDCLDATQRFALPEIDYARSCLASIETRLERTLDGLAARLEGLLEEARLERERAFRLEPGVASPVSPELVKISAVPLDPLSVARSERVFEAEALGLRYLVGGNRSLREIELRHRTIQARVMFELSGGGTTCFGLPDAWNAPKPPALGPEECLLSEVTFVDDGLTVIDARRPLAAALEECVAKSMKDPLALHILKTRGLVWGEASTTSLGDCLMGIEKMQSALLEALDTSGVRLELP